MFKSGLLLACYIFLAAFISGHTLAENTVMEMSNETHPANAVPISNSTLGISWYTRKQATKTNAILDQLLKYENAAQLQQISVLKVSGYGSISNFALLSSIILSLKSLEEIHWTNTDSPPGDVLETLRRFHPECKLYYRFDTTQWDSYAPDFIPVKIAGDEPGREERNRARMSLIGSTSLYSLDVIIAYGGRPNTESIMAAQLIVQSAPNLQELSIIFTHEGCVFRGPHPKAFDFSNESPFSQLPFPSLKSLKLHRYDLQGRVDASESYPMPTSTEVRWPLSELPLWAQKYIAFSAVESLHKPPDATESLPGKETNLDAWISKMRWDKLESLTLDTATPAILNRLRGRVDNLQELRIGYGSRATSLALCGLLSTNGKNIRTLSLSHVYFNDYNMLAATIAERIGPSLEHLSFDHMVEGKKRYTEKQVIPIPVLNTTQLNRLSKACTNLKQFKFDLSPHDLDAQYLPDILEALALFPSLEHLILVFCCNVGIVGTVMGADHGLPTAETARSLSQAWTEASFHKLREMQRTKLQIEPTLKSIKVDLGRFGTFKCAIVQDSHVEEEKVVCMDTKPQQNRSPRMGIYMDQDWSFVGKDGNLDYEDDETTMHEEEDDEDDEDDEDEEDDDTEVENGSNDARESFKI